MGDFLHFSTKYILLDSWKECSEFLCLFDLSNIRKIGNSGRPILSYLNLILSHYILINQNNPGPVTIYHTCLLNLLSQIGNWRINLIAFWNIRTFIEPMILNIDIMANMHRNLLPHQECHMMRRRNEECRNDLHLTSAGETKLPMTWSVRYLCRCQLLDILAGTPSLLIGLYNNFSPKFLIRNYSQIFPGVGQHSKLRPRDPPYNDQHYQTTGQGLIYRSSPAFPPRHFKVRIVFALFPYY